jgi:hypothetical protein
MTVDCPADTSKAFSPAVTSARPERTVTLVSPLGWTSMR